jgi:hypothetical protein
MYILKNGGGKVLGCMYGILLSRSMYVCEAEPSGLVVKGLSG